MSLRERLTALGIDGFEANECVREYYALTQADPSIRMGGYLNIIKREKGL